MIQVGGSLPRTFVMDEAKKASQLHLLMTWNTMKLYCGGKIKSLKEWEEIVKENSVVLTSSHKEVRDALKAAGINYYVVYPNLESFGKDFYLDRIRGRENGINSDSFVSLIAENCEDWIRDIEETTNKENIIVINKNVKLEEVILNIIQEGKDIFVVETILYDGNNISEIKKFLGKNYTIAIEKRPNGYCHIYPGDIRFKVNDCFYKRDNVIWIEKGSFDEG